MNKKNYLLLVLNLAVYSAFAQSPITLSALDVNRLVAKDTYNFVADVTGFEDFAEPETDMLWDFTDATYSTPGWIITRSANTSSEFPDAEFQAEFFRPFGGSLRFDAVVYFEANDSEIAEASEIIETDQVIPLASATGGADDQLVFPRQVVVYEGSVVERKFPSNFGDSWSSTRKLANNFNITVAAFGLNNTPGVYQSTETIRDSVAGWGSAIIKDANTNATSAEIEVQQVLRVRTRVDSFFLGGMPAPKALLDAFGLVQGAPNYTYECFFYRQGEYKALVEINYGSSEFETIEQIEIHEDNFVAQTASISSLDLENKISIYPNPAQDQIIIDLPAGDINGWSYSISNLQGQEIMKETFRSGNIIHFNDDLVNGLYVVKLYKHNTVQSTSRVAVNR